MHSANCEIPVRSDEGAGDSLKAEAMGTTKTVDPDGPVIIILATGSEVHGFNPARVDGFFQSVKMLSMASFGREVKLWVLCRRFTARKRTFKPKLEPLSEIGRTFKLTVESNANDLRC